jgi:aryl-alcohol dehydrogenase-like predicted oxidoreductase
MASDGSTLDTRMDKRKLGGQGLEVSAIGLGCMGMSTAYPDGGLDETEVIATFHRALELGVTLFDTAEAYGPFTNEELVGRALKGRRDQAIISTKFGADIQNGHIYSQGAGERAAFNSRPEHIREVADASLRRLQIECIDLFYQHRVDPAVPIEDVAGTVGDLVREGKVRYFGLSEASVVNIRRAHAVHPVSALQSEYSLWERNLEADIIPVLRELDIGLVAFGPLGKGFLTGNVKRAEEYSKKDNRRRDPRFQGTNFDANVAAASALYNLAAQKNVAPGQLAISWLLHKGDDIVPIPGTKRRTYLEQNVGAAHVHLTEAEMTLLEQALRPEAISGPRYDARNLATVDR